MIDWDDMRVFLALARMESLGRAGQQLRLDPATVGRRIARLEEGLGRRLFTRSHQGYALTDEGARLLPHAVAAENTMAAAAQEAGEASTGLSGQIRVGAPDGCANYLLPQVIATICEANPALDVQIIALPRVFNLSRREADMAIGVSAPQTGRLSVQKISDYHLHLAASTDYLSRHPPITQLADLRQHRIIGYIPDMIFDSELDYLSELGLERVALGSNSVAVQFNFIRHGAGLGVVHDFALPSAQGLARILPDQFSLKRSFYLIRHLDDRRVSRLNRFAEILHKAIRKELTALEGQLQ
ncbi:DNA-binding transcriptional LysR family regulator [Roseinatronobacter bogoriensis subsp. barguzinensis]|nr:DNA-binding transcriptional LysR family regulator [Rhodobaca bogoriensis DSM 18756]TDW33037.1 DNA-binding transcriptional LysR family regulator [Rhodobaca barguzinensis]TDY65874.1 LysR family transcriptional regulator [Rhodobaca bogoriensis DSM 18756]